MPEDKSKTEETEQTSTNVDDFGEFKSFIEKKKAQNKALKKLFDQLSPEQDLTTNN